MNAVARDLGVIIVVISAAKIDPRMKAVATVSMYNIGEMRRSGINHAVSLEQHKKVIAAAAEQRRSDFETGDQAFIAVRPSRCTNHHRPLGRPPMPFITEEVNSFLKGNLLRLTPAPTWQATSSS